MGVTGPLLDKGAALAATSPQEEAGQTHQKRQAVRSNRSQAATPVVTWAKQVAEKPVSPVIPRSPPFLLADDEESRTALKILRARFLAEFTLSEMRRSFSRDCGIRMTANGLGMTAWRHLSAACRSAIIIQQLQCDSGSVVSGTGATATTAGNASTTTARVYPAATAGEASTAPTGAPAATNRAASSLSVGHDAGP